MDPRASAFEQPESSSTVFEVKHWLDPVERLTTGEPHSTAFVFTNRLPLDDEDTACAWLRRDLVLSTCGQFLTSRTFLRPQGIDKVECLQFTKVSCLMKTSDVTSALRGLGQNVHCQVINKAEETITKEYSVTEVVKKVVENVFDASTAAAKLGEAGRSGCGCRRLQS